MKMRYSFSNTKQPTYQLSHIFILTQLQLFERGYELIRSMLKSCVDDTRVKGIAHKYRVPQTVVEELKKDVQKTKEESRLERQASACYYL